MKSEFVCKSLVSSKQTKFAFIAFFLLYPVYATFNYYQAQNEIDTASEHVRNASLASKKGDFINAQTEYSSALAIYSVHNNKFSSTVIGIKNNLALAYKAQGKMEEARDTLVSAVDGIQEITDENKDEVGIVMVNLANLLAEYESTEQAKKVLAAALKLIDPNSHYYSQANAALSKIEGR